MMMLGTILTFSHFIHPRMTSFLSLEDDFSAWRKELWPALCEHFGLPLPSDVNSDLERRFRITFFNKDSNEAKLADKNSKLHLVKKSSGPRVDG